MIKQERYPSAPHTGVFAGLVRQQIARASAIQRVCFATGRGTPFHGGLAASGHILIALFRGAQNTTFYRHVGLHNHILTPSQLFYIAPFCPNAFGWDYTCLRLGLQLSHDRLGMSWNAHKKPGEPARCPDIWYTRALTSSHEDLLRMFEALQLRSEMPDDAPLTIRLTALLYERILELILSPEPEPQRAPDTLAMVCAYLADNLGKPVNCKTVAAVFRLNPDYVSRIFRSEGGFTAYLNRLRILRARELLTQSRLRTAEIASMCGFAHPSYFIRVFRAQEGCTPQHFRHAHPLTRCVEQAADC